MTSTFDQLFDELKRLKKKPTKREKKIQAIASADATLIAAGLKSYSELAAATNTKPTTRNPS